MNWLRNKGYQPKIEGKVFVEYRCGMVSKVPYTVRTQRWTIIGDDFDIVAYAVPEDVAKAA